MKFFMASQHSSRIKHLLVSSCLFLFCLSANAEMAINGTTIQQLINSIEAMTLVSDKYPGVLPEDESMPFDDVKAYVKNIESSVLGKDLTNIVKSNRFKDITEFMQFNMRISVAYLAKDAAQIPQLEAMVEAQKNAIPALIESYKKAGMPDEKIKEIIASSAHMEGMIAAIKKANPNDITEVRKHTKLLAPIFDDE